MRAIRPSFFALFALLPSLALASGEKNPEILRAMNDELRRQLKELSLPDVERPYFIEYTILDVEMLTISATFGALSESNSEKNRYAKVGVRVGEPGFDQTNFSTPEDNATREQQLSGITFEDDYDVLRHELWLLTDEAYKAAVETFARKKAFLQSRNEQDRVSSFSSAAPVKKDWKLTPPAIDKEKLGDMVRTLSAIFRDYSGIYSSEVTLSVLIKGRYYVNSEGAEIYEPGVLLVLSARAETQAQDGTPLHDQISFYARDLNALPSQEELTKSLKTFAQELQSLREAKTLEEDYSGPVLFEGVAAGQVWESVVSLALSGTPAPESEVSRPPRQEGESLASRVGRTVLPSFLSLEDDPTLDAFEGKLLLGSYGVDEEGVLAEKVSVVEKGKLKTLLSSRTPSKEVGASNGHGRGSLFLKPRGRIANLIVKAQKTEKDIRARALKAAKAEGLPYVLVVKKLQIPAPLSIEEILLRGPSVGAGGEVVYLAYKLYPNGKEELVKNLSISDLNLRAMEEILAVGRDTTVYNYLADATSSRSADINLLGGIPTSIVTPSLLFPRLDVRVSSKAPPKPPVLTHPSFTTSR